MNAKTPILWIAFLFIPPVRRAKSDPSATVGKA